MRSLIIFLAMMLVMISCNDANQETTTSTTDSSFDASSVNQVKDSSNHLPQQVTIDNLPVMLGGEPMKATGNEPFWYLELRKDSVHFKLMGGFEFTEPLPSPVFNTADSVKYFLHTNNAEFTVIVKNKECTDGMSGFKSPFTVKAIFTGEDNTQVYHGCGDYAAAFDKPRENPQ